LPQELLEAYSLESIHGAAAETGKPALSVKELERAMWEAVEKLDFERAAAIRDMIAGKKSEESKEDGPGFSAGKKWKPQTAKRHSRRR